MHSINLYAFTRNVDENLLSLYERALSNRNEKLDIKIDEVLQIKMLVEKLLLSNIDRERLDNWFYSFTIPQISKEFDLLKIGKNSVINIELKSRLVPLEKIENQLKQNRYYLSNISNQIYSFSCVGNDDSLKIYQYINNTLQESSVVEIISAMDLIDEVIEDDIEKLFRPKDYLISPFNTPFRFIEGQYYLNGNQEKIKKEITREIENSPKEIWGIKGSAGTGKSLLLYDIAKTLSDNFKIGIVHSGILNAGHKFLNDHLNNVSIIEAKSITEELVSSFDIICVDEAQRLFVSGLKSIFNVFDSDTIRACIFSYDPFQILSYAEKRRDTISKIKIKQGFQERELSDKIRTNRELALFIRGMLRLYDTPDKSVSYNNIEIVYADTTREADIITNQYERKGFVHITFTPSKYKSNSIDHYSNCINTHHVIGQEFDNVLVVLDGNFLYSEKGELEARTHPNPDYIFPKLFYQNISRAREKLCIVVLNNKELFDKLIKLKLHETHYPKPEE